MDWLCQRAAKLVQEPVSGVTANFPKPRSFSGRVGGGSGGPESCHPEQSEGSLAYQQVIQSPAGLTARCFAPLSMTTSEPVTEWREMAGISPYYETNPIVRQATPRTDFPPNFRGLALSPAGETGPGAVFQGVSEFPRNGGHSAGGGPSDAPRKGEESQRPSGLRAENHDREDQGKRLCRQSNLGKKIRERQPSF